MISCKAPLKVVDDIGRIAATKTWHGYADLLVVVFKVDADVFLEFLPPPQRSIHRVLKDNPTMEQTVFWDLLRYIVVAIDKDRRQHQSYQENCQAQGKAAQAGWKRLLWPDWANRLPVSLRYNDLVLIVVFFGLLRRHWLESDLHHVCLLSVCLLCLLSEIGRAHV